MNKWKLLPGVGEGDGLSSAEHAGCRVRSSSDLSTGVGPGAPAREHSGQLAASAAQLRQPARVSCTT